MNNEQSFLERARNNVLLKSVPPLMSKLRWGEKLRHEPLKDAMPTIKSRDDAEACLHLLPQIFVPTRKTCTIAEQAHRLLLNGLIGRDLRDRPLVCDVAAPTGDAKGPWNPVTVSGMVLKSMTRQGKTHLINRIVHYLPHVIHHVDPWPGQKSLQQLVYLIVPMPSNASRKGFIYAAMLEMDKVLGTNYASRFNGRVSAEVELVKLLNLLKAHKCGMLIVEECQVQNAMGSKMFGADFATFFLSVLNSGIPTLIVGNSKAFQAIESHSQTLCRLSEGGLFDLHPAPDWLCEDWEEEFMPGLWGATIFDKPDEYVEGINELIWCETGGFHHMVARLRADALRFALEGSADHVRRADIDRAILKLRQAGDWPLINAFATRKPAQLMKFKDIVHDYYIDLWAAQKDAEDAAADEAAVPKPLAPATTAKSGATAVAAPKKSKGEPRVPGDSRTTSADEPTPQIASDDLRSVSAAKPNPKDNSAKAKL